MGEHSPASGPASLPLPTCPACGQIVQRGWHHCIYCGVTLNGCPQCGFPRQNVTGEAFCARCGAPLEQQIDLPTVPLEDHIPEE